MRINNWKQFNIILESNENEKFMYHVTKSENLENILQNGLLINQPYAMTEGGAWAEEAYGVNPIFLSEKPNETTKQTLLLGDFDTILEVNIDGLELIADLPALVDHGAYIGDNAEFLYWEEDEEPEEIIDLLDENGEIDMETLLDPGSWGMDDIIELTGSAAVLQNIDPSKIREIKL